MCISQQPTNMMGRKGLTLIIVRITLTEPKATLAGAAFGAPSAVFMASIAIFREESTSSRRFG